jgi:hypothetical protein
MPKKIKVQGPDRPEWLDPDHHPHDEPPAWLAQLKSGKKQDKKKEAEEQPKQKQWFQVRIEGTAPVTAEYRVLAIDEDEAFKLVEQGRALPLNKPGIDMRRLKKNKVLIKNIVTGWINWVRNF